MHDADDKGGHAAFMSALTTEHFVLQTTINATLAEASSRSSIYVYSLSSALVALGFVLQSENAFVPFVSTVFPAIFLLGVFTVLRLVDIAAENMAALVGIARLRLYYRSINENAAVYFSEKRGRWPEASVNPSLRLGSFVAYFTTNALMIAAINALVAGSTVALLTIRVGELSRTSGMISGAAATILLLVAFFFYQRYRIEEVSEHWKDTDVS